MAGAGLGWVAGGGGLVLIPFAQRVLYSYEYQESVDRFIRELTFSD